MSDVSDWLRRRGFSLQIDRWVYREGELEVAFSTQAVERAERDDLARRLLVAAVNHQLA